jgi:hypothetical protein
LIYWEDTVVRLGSDYSSIIIRRVDCDVWVY